jgi:hypothetical protein
MKSEDREGAEVGLMMYECSQRSVEILMDGREICASEVIKRIYHVCCSHFEVTLSVVFTPEELAAFAFFQLQGSHRVDKALSRCCSHFR